MNYLHKVNFKCLMHSVYRGHCCDQKAHPLGSLGSIGIIHFIH